MMTSSILGTSVGKAFGPGEGRSVVGSVERTLSGNIVLRVGHTFPDGHAMAGWTQTEYIVLSPAEARALMQRIEKHL